MTVFIRTEVDSVPTRAGGVSEIRVRSALGCARVDSRRVRQKSVVSAIDDEIAYGATLLAIPEPGAPALVILSLLGLRALVRARENAVEVGLDPASL